MMDAAAIKDYIISVRRWLHEHPEISGKELGTLAFIRDQLEQLSITYTEIPEGGILGFIDGGAGKTVMLRADIDALPIQEAENNLSGPKACISQTPGVSHACGHDAHTAMLLAEAKILQANKDRLPGSVILCFERGEEGGDNLRYIVEYLLAHPEIKIDTCYATHVRWDMPSGKLAVLDGAALAGAFGFDLILKGSAGHGSRPDLANNPIDCFVAVYNALNSVRMRQVDPFSCLTFSVGRLSAGSRLNVIPDELRFSGTARFFSSEKAGEPFATEFKKIIKSQTALFGCELEVVHMNPPLYETVNHPQCAAIAREAIAQYVGPDALVQVEPWTASESFGKLLKLYPGVMSFTGIKNEAVGSGANHHTPEFDVDEVALVFGVKAALGYTLTFMRHNADILFQRNIVSVEDLISRNI